MDPRRQATDSDVVGWSRCEAVLAYLILNLVLSGRGPQTLTA